MINKDTKLYGSFSDNPGNNGCTFFNSAFEKQQIDAIYKSFYGDDIVDIVSAVKTLRFSGFALSMPFKRQIIKYLDSIDDAAKEIGAVNTVVIEDGKLIGYNTDWIGIKNYFSDSLDKLTILGNGGFSKAVQYHCITKGIPYTVITRKDWGKVYDLEGYVFNATPIPVVTKGLLTDGRPQAKAGSVIAKLQAIEQFKIYTGIDYEDSLMF